MKKFIIQENDAGQRLDKFLKKAVPRLPEGLLYKYLRLKRIKVEGKRADKAQKLLAGEVVELYINDEFFDDRPAYAFLGAPAKVEIAYEDENVLLVNKPQGLVVHEDARGSADTLILRVLHYLYDKGEYDPARELSFVPALCNRLDRNTGGIVIVAKNAAAGRILNEKIKNREIQKEYLCLVKGVPSPQKGTLRHYLVKQSDKNRVLVYPRPTPGGKTALTDYEVLKTQGDLSLVHILLHTGRTHQIRAQMAYIGHPLLGDGKYGDRRFNQAYDAVHQALCAYKITFCFSTPAGELEYLNGKSVQLSNVWFCDAPYFRGADEK